MVGQHRDHRPVPDNLVGTAQQADFISAGRGGPVRSGAFDVVEVHLADTWAVAGGLLACMC